MFHSVAGCDTVTSFHSKGKKSAWETWLRFPVWSPVFAALSSPVRKVASGMMADIKWFVVLLYDRMSECVLVNHARKEMFTKKGRNIDLIPTSQSALIEHTKRAAFQEGHCWGQAFVNRQILPSPSDWGRPIIKENGSKNGQHCLTPTRSVRNYYTVVARKVPKRIANVLRMTRSEPKVYHTI